MLQRLSLMLMLVLGIGLGTSANAATLNVVAGQLVGASGVDVGGSLYDVEFVDGTCIDVFDGCDSAADFTFGDLASVNLASQALLDQVFLDGVAGDFDTVMTSTLGCTNAATCTAQTPYAVVDALQFSVGVALNFVDELADVFADGTNDRFADSSVGIGQFYMYAVWTPIPEPSTATLLALGLAALATRKRSHVG